MERKYADLFSSDTGNVAKPLRMALGSLIIQKKFQFSDQEHVEQITENPYLQYFIGLPGYQDEPPFDPSTLVIFRKRLDVDAIMDANAYMFDSQRDDDHTPPVKRIVLYFPDGMPEKHGKIILLMQNAGSIPGNRQGRRSGSSFPMFIVTWSILCRRATRL